MGNANQSEATGKDLVAENRCKSHDNTAVKRYITESCDEEDEDSTEKGTDESAEDAENNADYTPLFILLPFFVRIQS